MDGFCPSAILAADGSSIFIIHSSSDESLEARSTSSARARTSLGASL